MGIVGIFGIIWFVAWLIVVFNTPADHPRISPEEQRYIESSIGSQIDDNHSKKVTQKRNHLPVYNVMYGLAEFTNSLESNIHITSDTGHCHRPFCQQLGILYTSYLFTYLP